MKNQDQRISAYNSRARKYIYREKLVASLAGGNFMAEEELRLLLRSRQASILPVQPRG
jgi:hypothetical protein